MSQLLARALPERQKHASQQKISAFSCHHSAQFTIPTCIHTEDSGTSIHLNPRLFARFLSFRWKVNPLYSSEIKTGRCKQQINVIKCLCYHKPSHQSGWLAHRVYPLLSSCPQRIAAPSFRPRSESGQVKMIRSVILQIFYVHGHK